MPTQHEDRLGLLVLRASVEQPEKRLVVQVLEVDPAHSDRVLGVVHSASEAARLVQDWLDLQATR